MLDSNIPGGYILLSRKLLQNGIMEKPPLYFKIWVWLLLNAQHKDFGVLKRGQLRTSIPEIQKAMTYKVGYREEKPSRKQIWGILNWLRNPDGLQPLRNPHEGTMKGTTAEPMIETVKVTHGLVITICNYSIYQDPKSYEGNNDSNNEGTTREQRREQMGNNNNKNDKNDKNDKKVIYSPDHLAVAEHLLIRIRENKPDFKEPNLKQWANTIRLMEERDNRSLERIREVIDWCQRDEFWQSNILSADKLRKQFDKLEIQMNRRPHKSSNLNGIRDETARTLDYYGKM